MTTTAAECPICGTPAGDCPICGTEGGCRAGHTAGDHAAYDADMEHLARQCGICGSGELAVPGDEATCANAHTPEELARRAGYRSGGENHLPGCQEFADYDGSAACDCGGMACGSGFSMGPASDPYGVACQYILRDHPRDEHGKALHRGVNPLPGPGGEPQYLEWTGGGSCAGDPLPYAVVRHLLPCPAQDEPVRDEDLHAHLAAVHGWTVAGLREDDYWTLRAMHAVAAEHAGRRRDGQPADAEVFAQAFASADNCDTCWYLCSDQKDMPEAEAAARLRAHFASGHRTTSDAPPVPGGHPAPGGDGEHPLPSPNVI